MGLTAFLADLRHALGRGPLLTIALSTETAAGACGSDGYRLRAIGRETTGVILTGYDENGPWTPAPGPVGALPWQRAGLRVLLRYVPAARGQLGVAGYGYARCPGGTVMVSDRQARALAARRGAHVQFDAAAGERTASLPDGSVEWWSDARSYRLRIALARRLHLAGLAVWSLGLSDTLPPAG